MTSPDPTNPSPEPAAAGEPVLAPTDSDPPPVQPPPSNPRAEGRYEHMRARVTSWAERKGGLTAAATHAVLTLPDFLWLLCGLAADPDVPPKQKAKAVMAIAYILSPLDLLPESLFGPFGYLDDVAVAVIVLNNLLNNVDPAVIDRHWRGDGDAIRIIRNGVGVADELIGSGLLKRLSRFLET